MQRHTGLWADLQTGSLGTSVFPLTFNSQAQAIQSYPGSVPDSETRGCLERNDYSDRLRVG